MPRENKRAAILQAAIEQFSYCGYSGASVDSIAQKIGISKTLIFKYYDSKEELLVEVMRHIQDNFLKRLVEIAEKEADSLEEFTDRIFRIIKRHRSQWQLVLSMRSTPSLQGIDRNISEKMFHRLETTLAGFVSEEETGEVRLFCFTVLGLYIHYIVTGDEKRFYQSKGELFDRYIVREEIAVGAV